MTQLKKRIQEKELQKQKDDKLDVKLAGIGRNKRKQVSNISQTKKGKGFIIKGTLRPNQKIVRKENKKSTSGNRPGRGKNKGSHRPKNIRNQIAKPPKSGTRHPKKITPPKTGNKIIKIPQIVQVPVKKIKVKPSNQPNQSIRPEREQKPIHKPKKDIQHKNEDEEDFFQIGSVNSHQHSDQHTHHHDHLEAHKHHHKHKASHSHDHAHSNDHVHNHKHTHNHVHNHIHKHNEAHEHTATHSHTEKHKHKHLEYIDAGGWRRRSDAERQSLRSQWDC